MESNETILYESPEVEVYETSTQNVICASPLDADNAGYNASDYKW